jgi:DNA polymerase I
LPHSITEPLNHLRAALQTGYVSTIMGRRRYLPGINSSDSSKRSQAERQAVNSIIQGSASDIIKFAMLDVERQIDQLSLSPGVRAVMQIHDELIFEVESCLQHDFVAILRKCMESHVQRALSITVPLVTNVHIGETWGAMTAYVEPSFPHLPPTGSPSIPSADQSSSVKRRRQND